MIQIPSLQEIYETQKRATLDALTEFEEIKAKQVDPFAWVPEFINREDLAEALSCHKNTLIKWEGAGILEPTRHGHTIRYSREAVIRALEEMKGRPYFKKVK